ncbi:hypothetical protein Prudu_005883 [Prunus dulcis]|uniref:Ubiquitin-like protease family profile domain-containing protein n=1 Tax=Prunus dulcis TaxID=3755 RepID=A0A4Y1QYH8_PRUDU|nr:hypothetical protein Prudu_005883 [Prunus dulcis]
MPGDELQKQVSEGKVSVSGSNDVLTMALGPEHPGRVRGVGAGISPRQYFNLPKPQRLSFDDRLKDSKGRGLRMEARTKQLVEAEREHFLSQLSQLIPNFDPSMLKPRISQSPKNPMSDKASCSGGDRRKKKKDEEKKEEKQDEKEKEDEEKHDDKAPSSLKSLCRYVETTLVPEDKTCNFTIDKEVFGLERDTFVLPEDITQFAGMEEIGATVVAVYMRYLHDVLKQANMCSMVGFIDPATPSLDLADCESKEGNRLFSGSSAGNRVVDEEGKNIVNSAIKIYNSHIARAGRKAVIWKTLSGTPKQPSSVECGYYVMRFMRDIIMDPSLAFEKKYAKGNRKRHTPRSN